MIIGMIKDKANTNFSLVGLFHHMIFTPPVFLVKRLSNKCYTFRKADMQITLHAWCSI